MITWLKYLHEALIIHPKGDEMKAEARELIKEYEKLQAEIKRLEKYELFAWACPMCGNHDPNFFWSEALGLLRTSL